MRDGSQPFYGVEQVRHMPRHLPMPASGQQNNQPVVGRQSQFLARPGRFYNPRQRMSDELRRDPVLLKKRLFKGENTQQPLQRPPHRFDSSPPPSPGLRSD